MKKQKISWSKIFHAIMAISALAVGGFFFADKKLEIFQAIDLMKSGSLFWILVGLSLTVVYILLQGYMYVACFTSFGSRVSLGSSTKLFLKRNLISVGLPAGGVTSLLFFSKDIISDATDKSTVHKASYIYGLFGIISLVALAVPVFLLWGNASGNGYTATLTAGVAVTAIVTMLTFSIAKKGWAYRALIRVFPKAEETLADLTGSTVSIKHLCYTMAISFLIEVVGIAHLYVSMLIIGVEPSVFATITTYSVSTILYCFSPFLKGLGAVEISMTLLLTAFGYSGEQAISLTLLYRVFEFWLPLVVGALSFFITPSSIPMRLFPSISLFLMGAVNIASALTPSLSSRTMVLDDLLSTTGMYISNSMVLFSGVLLTICAGFLLLGYRASWYVAVVLSLGSLVTNLMKGLDYEESYLFFLLLIVLFLTKKHYYIHREPYGRNFNWKLPLWTFCVVMAYGVFGFYFLEPQHFGIDISLWQALRKTVNSFLLFNDAIAEPNTVLASIFLYSINFFGMSSLVYLVFSFLWSKGHVLQSLESTFNEAELLLAKHGRSPLDYFKTYEDKKLFFSSDREGFIAYRTHLHTAVVLEGPVCSKEIEKVEKIIKEFEAFCRLKGMSPVYYRVDGRDLEIYRKMRKKHIAIGQEAVVDIDTFSLEGKKRKSLRNAVNSVEKKGFTTKIHQAPIPNNIIQQLQHVSDSWLKDMKRKELWFAQGIFDPKEIKNHTVITLEDAENQIVAFLNVIPDYAEDEITYDLIRKTSYAPGGNMDILLLRLFDYCREQGIQRVNMGLVPFSGIGNCRRLPTLLLDYLYRRSRFFEQYRGLREFKEKFDPSWGDKFMVYEHDYNLFSLLAVMRNIIEVKKTTDTTIV